MMNKCLLVICDGLGDRPIKKLKGKTPLESAKTPNLDKLAKLGITGLYNAIGFGVIPGSDTSHLAILGYDPEEYYSGRGVFECAGVGMKPSKGDTAFRANLGTVDKNMKIIDRRAGRIDSTKEFIEKLNGTVINGVKFLLRPGTAHRVALVMRGKGLSSNITDNDPHEAGRLTAKVKPKDKSKEAKFTANILNEFLLLAHKKLSANPLNAKRVKAKKLPANYLLCRGASHAIEIPSFYERFGLRAACIAGAGLYKGIGKVLGMDVLEVRGATGKPNTDVKAKFKAAKKALKKYDFVFVHIKPADNLGEDGNYLGKKKFIEKIDAATKMLFGFKNTLIVVTADHSTPCEKRAHSGDPVPLLMYGDGVRTDNVKSFGERSCASGSLGRLRKLELISEILNLLDKGKLYGA